MDLYIPNWLIVIAIILITLYILLTWRFNELKELGIPHPKPIVGIGNFSFNGKDLYNFDLMAVRKYGRVVGLYEGMNPTILVADPEIVKNIAIKDFACFTNRREDFFQQGELGLALTNLKDEHWKTVRKISSVAFATGKLKNMVPMLNAAAELFVASLKERSEFEGKVRCLSFTMDCIARVAFGVEINTQQDDDNQFMKNGRKIIDFSFKDLLHPTILLSVLWPAMAKLVSKFYTSTYVEERLGLKFFCKVIRQAREQRKELKNPPKDVLQLLTDAHKEIDNDGDDHSKSAARSLTDGEVDGQLLLFLFAGFDTVSTALSFLLRCLMENQECQEKAYQEIKEIWQDTDKALTYEDILKIKYIDQCIEETLRIYSPAIRVDRICKETVVYGDLKIPKGYIVNIAIRPMHLDPEFFPNPEKFDPKRFSVEGKANQVPYSYIPFGLGPRMCIASRLGLLEVKLGAIHLLRHFKFCPSEKTEIPLKMDNGPSPKAVNGLWMKAVSRENL